VLGCSNSARLAIFLHTGSASYLIAKDRGLPHSLFAQLAM